MSPPPLCNRAGPAFLATNLRAGPTPNMDSTADDCGVSVIFGRHPVDMRHQRPIHLMNNAPNRHNRAIDGATTTPSPGGSRVQKTGKPK